MCQPQVLQFDEVFHGSPFSASVFAYFLLIKKVFDLIFSLVGIFIIDHRFLSLFTRSLLRIIFLWYWFGSKELGERRLEILKVSSHLSHVIVPSGYLRNPPRCPGGLRADI